MNQPSDDARTTDHVAVATIEDTYWSVDEERYPYDSLEDLLGCNAEIEAGQEVFFGEGETPDPGSWVDADDIIEQLACRANDECGEFADDYPDVTKEAKDELDELLQAWARKYATPSWYMIKRVGKHVVTAEEIAEANAT